jgi:uncharacterized protein (TIGR02391 family)
MNSLPETIPDEELLLALETEELAGYVLKFGKRQSQNGLFHLGNFQSSLFVPNVGGHKYGQKQQDEITLAVAEAWSWLEVQGLLVTAPGMNGPHGFKVLSRRALKLGDQDDLRLFAKARRIEKASLHPRIAQSVWSAFMRSEFDVAAFQAMKAVEVAVREAGGFTAADLGTDLMRAAFHEEKGPLTDLEAEKSERQARAHLFAGVIGSYKNALSHRDVNIDDPDEALEIVMLANHLLRIVDRRKAARKL